MPRQRGVLLSQREETAVGIPSVDPDRFKHLPEPIRLDDMVTSQDATTYPEEKTDELREVEWLIRTTGF
jgi:hypothetical protein